MYDPAIAGEAERKRAFTWISRTLPLIHAALVKAHSALDSLLSKLNGAAFAISQLVWKSSRRLGGHRGQRAANGANSLAENAVSGASGVPI